jgi:transposase
MSNLDTCGIEVSAQELVLMLRRQGDLEPLRNFTNTPEGHQALIPYLRRAGRGVRVCLESTGLYGLDLALALSGQEGIEVMVANPRAVRHFAQAMMKRSKNDQIDAGVLEQFAARMPFQAWQRPSPAGLPGEGNPSSPGWDGQQPPHLGSPALTSGVRAPD